MNYRHAYHAGNKGDVLKHAALASILAYLGRKAAPYRVVDLHAGLGLYHLDHPNALATGEWEAGVGALWEDRPGGAAGAALAPWYATLDALNPSGKLTRYPGSPELALRLMRPTDKAVFCELHPEDGAALKRRYADEPRARVRLEDGWAALGALLPPPERRGLVVVDPPFEQPGEYHRLTQALATGFRRFATGVYVLWYPIKGEVDRRGLRKGLKALAIPRTLVAELLWHTPNNPSRMDGAGVVVVNPPFPLAGELEALLPELARRFATGPGAEGLVEAITPLE